MVRKIPFSRFCAPSALDSSSSSTSSIFQKKRSFLHFDYLLPFIPIFQSKRGNTGKQRHCCNFSPRERDFSIPVPVLFYSTNIRPHYILFHQICDQINARERNMQTREMNKRYSKNITSYIYRTLCNIALSCILATCIIQLEIYFSKILSREQMSRRYYFMRRKMIF